MHVFYFFILFLSLGTLERNGGASASSIADADTVYSAPPPGSSSAGTQAEQRDVQKLAAGAKLGIAAGLSDAASKMSAASAANNNKATNTVESIEVLNNAGTR